MVLECTPGVNSQEALCLAQLVCPDAGCALQVMYLIARFRPKLLKNADTSGPYGVSAEDAAAAIAKVSGTIQEQSEIADRIAAAAQ